MVLLGQGERIIARSVATKVSSKGSRDGILILTNHRLVFEGRAQQGLVTGLVRGPKAVTLLDARLDQLSNVHVDKPLIGRAILRVEFGGAGHRFGGVDAGAWASSIRNARVNAPSSQYGVPSQVVVNVQAPVYSPPAPPPPPPQVFLHCQYCGSRAPSGTTKCPGCGHTLWG
jgi:hypothetical protein